MIVPWGYQCEVAEACWRNIKSKENALFVLPTGCGKTLISAMIIDAQLSLSDGIVLFVCPTRELTRQQLYALRTHLPHRLVLAVSDPAATDAEVLVGTAGAMLQGPIMKGERELARISLLVLDECHHCRGSSEYMELVQFQRSKGIPLLGMTATPTQSLSSSLNATVALPSVFLDELMAKALPPKMQWVEGEDSQLLATAFWHHLKSNFGNFDEQLLLFEGSAKIVGEYYTLKHLQQIFSSHLFENITQLNELAKEALELLRCQKKCSDKMMKAIELLRIHLIDNTQAIVFCGTRACAVVASEVLQEEGFASRSVLGGSGSKKASQNALEGFKNGDVQILTATNVLEEGIDIPSCAIVIRLDASLSLTGLIQSRGRIRCKHADGRLSSQFFCIGNAELKFKWERLLKSEKVLQSYLRRKSKLPTKHSFQQIKDHTKLFQNYIRDGGTPGDYLHAIIEGEGVSKQAFESYVAVCGLLIDDIAEEEAQTLMDQSLQCAMVVGEVMGQDFCITQEAPDPAPGFSAISKPFGSSIVINLVPFQKRITAQVVRKALSIAPASCLLEFVDMYRATTAKNTGIHQCKLCSVSFGILPDMNTGFLQVTDVSCAKSVEIEHGKGLVIVRGDESYYDSDTSWFWFEDDESPSLDTNFFSQQQISFQFSLSNLSSPVIIDGTKIYFSLCKVPLFHAIKRDTEYRKTKIRVAPPPSLGLGISLVLCLELSSDVVLYGRIIRILEHFGVRVFFGKIPVKSDDKNAECFRMIENARQLSSWDLFMKGELAANPGGVHDTQIHKPFLQYLSLFGESPWFAAVSGLLNEKVWENFKMMDDGPRYYASDEIVFMLSEYCFVPWSHLVSCMQQVNSMDSEEEDDMESLRIYLTLSSVYCVKAPKLEECRGLSAWTTFCHNLGYRTSIAQLVVDDAEIHEERNLLAPMVKDLFHGSLQILGREGFIAQLVPLHWSMSMLRNNGMLVVTEPQPGLVTLFLNEILLEGELASASVAKKCSRLALCFTVYKDSLDGVIWKDTEDIGDKTDGAGKIDADFLHKHLKNGSFGIVAQQFQTSPAPPTIQIRMEFCKGVLQPERGLQTETGYSAVLCKSMVKARVGLNRGRRGSKLFICEYARRFPLYLNHQIILLLLARGVQKEVFVQMLHGELSVKFGCLKDDETAFHRIRRTRSPFLNSLMNAKKSEVSPASHFFFRSILAHCVRKDTRDIRRRGRLRVHKGALLMGVPDFTGSLHKGQVFINVSPQPEAEGQGIITGLVICTKNPCLHPGDIRIFTAVDASSDLGHLCNVIVFPTADDVVRPHPDEMSGSDLDGDLFWVSWDARLFPPSIPPASTQCEFQDELGNVAAMDYTPKQASFPPQDRCSYFLRSIESSSLGILSNSHKYYADAEQEGAYSEKCLKLAELCSDAVDAPKTGLQLEIPKELIVPISQRPEWMFEDEDDRRNADKKDSFMQEISDITEEFEMNFGEKQHLYIGKVELPDKLQLICNKMKAAAPTEWEKLIYKTRDKQATYHRLLRKLMRRFGVWSEAEAITCELLPHRGYTRDEQVQHSKLLRESIKKLHGNFLIQWKRESHTAEAQAIADAMGDSRLTSYHVIACLWYFISHQEPREIASYGSKRLFVSFGWIAFDALQDLLAIVTSTAQMIRTSVAEMVNSISPRKTNRLLSIFPGIRWQSDISWSLPLALWFQILFDEQYPKSNSCDLSCTWPLGHPAAKLIVTMARKVSPLDLSMNNRPVCEMEVIDRQVWERICNDAIEKHSLVFDCLKLAVSSSLPSDDGLYSTLSVASATFSLSPGLKWARHQPTRASLGVWKCAQRTVDQAKEYLKLVLSKQESINGLELSSSAVDIVERKFNGQFKIDMVVKQKMDCLHLKKLQSVFVHELSRNISMEQRLSHTYQQSSCQFDQNTQRKILQKIGESDVSIVVGETGSGKSSLLPQLLLDEIQVGTGRYSRIFVTEPRRVAAVALATDVAHKRGWELGKKVGYIIGGERNESGMKDTRLLYVTNSICAQILASLGDRNPPFTHIILDEIHIRSRYDDLNMAVLRHFLTSRMCFLKVILMSATANVDELKKYFLDKDLKLSVIQLPSPKFKVKKYYLDQLPFYRTIQKEWQDEGLQLLPDIPCQSVLSMCNELEARMPSGSEEWFGLSSPTATDWLGYLVANILFYIHAKHKGSGRILCFLPGEKEISLVSAWLHHYVESAHQPYTCRKVIGTQTVESQQSNLTGESASVLWNERVILLASDVVESCVTPVNLQIVVDCCLQKRVVLHESGLSGGLRYHKLQTQYISKAEAQQRAGRAGRESDGIVYHLASQDFFENRLQQFPIPEMNSIGLDDLLLQFCAARRKNTSIGFTEEKIIDVFSEMLNPPPRSAVQVAIGNLREVGALRATDNDELTVTPILGNFLQHTYMEPRNGLLLLNGLRFGHLSECVAIVALLTTRRPIFDVVGDYRWKIFDFQQAVKMRRGWDMSSDIFAQVCALFAFKYQMNQSPTENFLKSWCKEHYISYGAMMEAHSHFDEVLRQLYRQRWASPEEVLHDIHSSWGYWARCQKVVCTCRIRPKNDAILNLILLATFPDCLVRQSIEKHAKVPLHAQLDWTKQLKIQLRNIRRKRRRNKRKKGPTIQDDIGEIENFFGTNVQHQANRRPQNFVLLQFNCTQDCINKWHEIKGLPNHLLKWNTRLNATYKFERIQLGKINADQKCFNLPSSFIAPVAQEQALFLAIGWLKVGNKKRPTAYTELFSDATLLPFEWSQPNVLDALLYATAPSVKSESDALTIMLSGRHYKIKTEGMSESAKTLRDILEIENYQVHQGISRVKENVENRLLLTNDLLKSFQYIGQSDPSTEIVNLFLGNLRQFPLSL